MWRDRSPKYPFPINQPPISLDVRFKLTDDDNKPLPGVGVRLVFGCDPNWQKPDAGHRFVTDEVGEHRLTAEVTLDMRRRKLPTNFLDSLFSRRQKTDHLKVGAELEFMDSQRLYMVDICRFPDGYTVMQDGFSVYEKGVDGNFTKAINLGVGSLIHPGFRPDGYMLQPAEDNQGWTLKLGFKQGRRLADR